MYEQKIRIGMGHIDTENRLKLGCAADLLQNASWFQMDTEREMLAYFAEHGLNMYLVSRQVDIRRLPVYGEEVTLRAWIYGCDRYYGLRNTVMYGQDGEVCMSSSARGAFISLETARGFRISEEAVKLVKPEPQYPMELQPRKIALPKVEPQTFEQVTVRSYHLDSFRHMNNARYVDIATGYLPDGFKPGRLRIEYKRASTLGQKLTPKLYAASPTEIVISLDGEDGPHCVLEMVA